MIHMTRKDSHGLTRTHRIYRTHTESHGLTRKGRARAGTGVHAGRLFKVPKLSHRSNVVSRPHADSLARTNETKGFPVWNFP